MSFLPSWHPRSLKIKNQCPMTDRRRSMGWLGSISNQLATSFQSESVFSEPYLPPIRCLLIHLAGRRVNHAFQLSMWQRRWKSASISLGLTRGSVEGDLRAPEVALLPPRDISHGRKAYRIFAEGSPVRCHECRTAFQFYLVWLLKDEEIRVRSDKIWRFG